MSEIVLTEELSTPSTPAGNKWKIYTKSDGLYIVDDAGAAIGPLGDVAAASTTVAGKVELATDAETVTGTDATRATTPAGVAAAVGGGDGWTAGTGTWSYSSADDPTFVVSINADVTALIGVRDRIKLTQTTAKYFIVTAVGAFGGGATLVTVYGGTDYDLANAAITSPYYSHHKSPFGFPASPAKWTVTATDTTQRSQASAVQNTWYNLGAVTISLPIGAWDVQTSVLPGVSSGGPWYVGTTLSTANNSASDARFTVYFYGSNNYIGAFARGDIIVAAKTSYYLNTRTTTAGAPTIYNINDSQALYIVARCAYL